MIMLAVGYCAMFNLEQILKSVNAMAQGFTTIARNKELMYIFVILEALYYYGLYCWVFKALVHLALLNAYLTVLWITDAEITANLRQRLLFHGEHLPCDIISLHRLRQSHWVMAASTARGARGGYLQATILSALLLAATRGLSAVEECGIRNIFKYYSMLSWNNINK